MPLIFWMFTVFLALWALYMVCPEISQESNKAMSIITPIVQIGTLRLLKIKGVTPIQKVGESGFRQAPWCWSPSSLIRKWQRDTKEHPSEFWDFIVYLWRTIKTQACVHMHTK